MDLDRLLVDPGTVTAEPLVGPGQAGTFDDSGCTVSCLVRHDDGRWFLYYTGWMLGRTVPFYLSIGLAVSDDDGLTFRKLSPAPLIERGAGDPFLTASPSILVENGIWRMWYVSGVGWDETGDGLRPRYLIKYAESRDGIRWERTGRIAIDFEDAGEYAMGRPHVIHDGGLYRMWYCIRGDRYRIAYAQSEDGLVWERCDALHEAPPRQDWDGRMQAYPMVYRDGDRWVMLYNGDGYGATGFGCAVAGSTA